MPKEGSFRKNLKNYLARTNFCGYLILQLAKTVLLRNLISGWVEKLKNKISESKKELAKVCVNLFLWKIDFQNLKEIKFC